MTAKIAITSVDGEEIASQPPMPAAPKAEAAEEEAPAVAKPKKAVRKPAAKRPEKKTFGSKIKKEKEKDHPAKPGKEAKKPAKGKPVVEADLVEQPRNFREKLSMIGTLLDEKSELTVRAEVGSKPAIEPKAEAPKTIDISDEKPPVAPSLPTIQKAGVAPDVKVEIKSALPQVNLADVSGTVPPRRIGLYRRYIAIFTILVIALLAGAAYFLFAKVDIVLIPNQERVTNSSIVDIYDKDKNADKADVMKGVVAKTVLGQEATCTSTAEEVIGEEVSGKVTIVNNYDKNQPLVATTRLLSADNKLYRLKETVNVPAGGSVEVEAYADIQSAESAVGVTKFTIPGLWAGLQDKIYAENKEPIAYRKKSKFKIGPNDIADCIASTKQALLEGAKTSLTGSYRDYSQVLYKIDENTLQSTVAAKAGDEVESFKVSLKADVAVVAFDGQKAGDVTRDKFVSALGSNKELIEFNQSSLIYNLDSYDAELGSASVKIVFEGKVMAKDQNIVDKNKILGLSKQSLDAYLSSKTEIAGYEVKFFPSFIKCVPKLPDRIKIEVKK